MSDASEAPTRADTTEIEPATEAPDETTDTPYGVETALGGATREHLRNASPIVDEIRKTLEFHASGTASQAVRDVLGSIERAATEASRRRPKNRPPEFAELSPPALRQLAALCRVYAMVDTVDLAPSVPSASLDIGDQSAAREFVESLPSATLTVTMDNTNATFRPERIDSAAAIARIEAGLIAERDAVKMLESTLGAERVEPDPFIDPAPISGTYGPTDAERSDLFSNPAPLAPEVTDLPPF